MTCDIDCFAKLEGSCKAQCSTPDGALMCKDADGVYQFVNATSVKTCVDALIAQGLQVDVSATATVTCDLSGCDGAGSANVGGFACAASPGSDSPFAPLAIAMGVAAAGISVARRRNRQNG